MAGDLPPLPARPPPRQEREDGDRVSDSDSETDVPSEDENE